MHWTENKFLKILDGRENLEGINTNGRIKLKQMLKKECDNIQPIHGAQNRDHLRDLVNTAMNFPLP
jgi:hypothetical protein